MKFNLTVKYSAIFIFIVIVFLILFNIPGPSRKSYEFYCNQVKEFYDFEFYNGVIVENKIEINNHGIRELVISINSNKLLNLRVIDPIDWENVDMLIIGELVSKKKNSFVVVRENGGKLNILTYCNDFFTIE